MRATSLLAFILALASGSALAQAPAKPPAPPAAARPAAPPAATPAPAASADPVVARVGNEEIRSSDLSDAAQALPEELRGMPPNTLYPLLLDQLIDRKILVIAARKAGLPNDPAVQRQVARATETALQNALLLRDVGPGLTEEAVRARYERDYAGKSGEEEVRARHILVADEATAQRLLAEARAGADFAELASKNSTDPTAQSGGGDLGFFKRGDMLPEFAGAAFALQPGEIAASPVQTRFGWHVIKVEERRVAPPPPFEQVRDEIRQSLIQDGVKRVLDEARVGLVVTRYNPDGSAVTAPPPAAPAATPAPSSPAPAR